MTNSQKHIVAFAVFATTLITCQIFIPDELDTAMKLLGYFSLGALASKYTRKRWPREGYDD